MLDLFGAGLSQLRRPDLEAFLEAAGEEGLTWEAKGGRADGSAPRPEALRKAACGFANQIGGYIIVGASRRDDGWVLDGIRPPTDEPALWIGQILRGLTPVPRFELSEVFALGEGRVALVVKIEPVAAPPCMTPQGRVYERVSGETLPVQDPSLLERLLRRGDQARARAENFARRACERAISLPDWPSQRSLSIAVGLACLGRETDDISARLFTDQSYKEIDQSIRRLLDGVEPERLDVGHRQDAVTALADSPAHTHYDHDNRVIGINRSSMFVQANWDGSVAAGAWFGDDQLQDRVYSEQLIAKFWRQAARVAELLGGYGPAYLHVLAITPGTEGRGGEKRRIAGRPPPPATFYARLPPLTAMGRTLDSAEPSEEVVESLHRELQRAAGIRADEPINQPG